MDEKDTQDTQEQAGNTGPEPVSTGCTDPECPVWH